MNPEKIAQDLARKNDGQLLRFRETPTQVIVLLTDGRKFYYDKASTPSKPSKPANAPRAPKKNAEPKEE